MCAGDGRDRRQLAGFVGINVLDQAKVQHLHYVGMAAAFAQHNVMRLDVAMHQTDGMRLGQRSANLLEDMDGATRMHGPIDLNQLRERQSGRYSIA